MKRLLYLFLLSYCSLGVSGQGIKGKIVDRQNQPIESVTVVLQTLDSVFVDAVITDSLGVFLISQSIDKPHILFCQHLLYDNFHQDINSNDVGVIQLQEKDILLGEVTVNAERPQVKVEGGKFTYDIPQLMKNKTSTNAFEIIRELPGVMVKDELLELAGAGSLHIIINGQLSTMSLEQLIQLLKTVPASRVQKAEVMYNAPARYNIKGALINVVLDNIQSELPTFQGEAGIDYGQRHYASGDAHVNLLYSKSGLNIDFLANGDKGRVFTGEDMEARHTLGNEITHIEQIGRGRTNRQSGTARIGIDYTFRNKDKLSASYYLLAVDSEGERNSETTFTPLATNISSVNNSLSVSSGTSILQNARIQYDGHSGIMAGVDYTGYHDPDKLHFQDVSNSNEETNMRNEAKQDVSRWSAFANHTHSFQSGWTVNYGVNAGYASSKNKSDYWYNYGNGYEPDEESRVHSTQEEYSGNVFGEVSKSFGEKFSATVAMKTEYFKSDYNLNGDKTTLWDDWALFPTISTSYMFSPSNILQLNVSSDKTYPLYWTVSPQEVPLNSYSVVVGNPSLKPYRSYDMQLVYIFRQKYMLIAFCNYEPDYFAQVPYQSDNEIKNVFRYENFDYGMKTGLVLIAPFQIGKFWSTRLTVNGFIMQEKSDHFHDMSFNKKGTVGTFRMNNTFNLSTKPNLKLTVDVGYITAGAIQGLYDLGSQYTVSAGLKWTFMEEKASLTLNAHDIFRSSYPRSIEINEGSQWNRMKKINDVNYVKLSFVYKFGGYKSKKHDKVDTSRFGR